MHCVLKPPRRWKGWWKAALNRETQRVLSQGLASLADPWGRPPGPAGIVKTEAGIVKTEGGIVKEVVVKSEVPASVKKELAANATALQNKDAALDLKEKELEAVRAELQKKNAEQEKSLTAIIEGAKAQGVCMHKCLHRHFTIHRSVICFHASRLRPCPSTAGRA